MFGQNSNNVFGQPTFGSNFNMNQTQTQPQQSSLFGQPQQTNTLFGGTSQPSNTFFGNSSTNTTGFGIQQPQTSTFGTTNSLFGNSTLTQQNNNATTSLFGNNNNTTGFGMAPNTSAFGSLGMQAPIGTTIKFQPQSSTDSILKGGAQTAINIKLNCITCMKEYENKSLDELRIEDYAANRKGPSMGSNSTGTSLFGTSTMSTGGTSLFGQTNSTNTFGSNTTNSLFGNNQNKPTGFASIAPASNTTTSLFGSSTLNQNKPTGFGFGATNTTNIFGQQTQPQQQNNSLFGSTAPQQSNTLFGGTTGQQSSIFGQTSQPSSIFGNNNQANQNKTLFGGTAPAFGQTNTGTGLFGSTTNTGASTFGASTSQSSLFGGTNAFTSNNTNTFGAPKPAFGGFGTSTNTGFGANTSSSSLFGTTNTGTNVFGATSTAPAGTGLFGTSTSGSSLFPSSNTGTTGFGFGTSSATFGAPASNATTGTTFGGFGTTNTGFGSSNTFGGGSSLFGNPTNTITPFGAPQQQQQQQQQAPAPLTNTVNTQQILHRLEIMPYGAMTQLPVDSNFQTSTIKTKFTTNPKTLNQYKINARSQQQNGPGVLRVPTGLKPSNLLFDGLDDENIDNTKCANDIFSPRTSVKKLVLNKKGDISLTPQSMKNLFSPKVKKFQTDFLLDSTPKMESTRIVKPPENDTTVKSPVANDTMADGQQFSSPQNGRDDTLNGSLDMTFGLGQSQSGDDSIIFGEDETDQNRDIPNCGIILTRPEYFTIPSLEECDECYNPDTDTCIVDSFTVTRTGYGSIFWPGPLDVKGLNLDEIVHIRRKEAIVYPEDDVKPPLGQGLNRPAQITLDQVWPLNKSTRAPIKDPAILANYTERLEAATHRLDAVFKEYRPETGSWVFTVKHFSKYGLEDDDDVDMESVKQNENENIKNLQTTKILPNEFNQETFVSKITSLTNLQDIKSKPTLRERNRISIDENENLSIVKSKNAFEKNPEIELMQNVLFNDDDEDDEDELNSSAAKKAKNSSFTKSQTLITTGFPSVPIIPASVRSSNVKKRVLRINPRFEKSLTHVNSLHMSSSRVQFFNGSNRFCVVSGKSVFIMDYDIAKIDTSENIDKLKEHLHREVLVKSSLHCIPPQRKCSEFVLSNGLSQSMTLLIEALFGQLNEQFPYARYQERFQRIKNWLISYNKQLEVPMDDSWRRILHFLTTNEVDFAVTESQISKNYRLGFLIASCAAKDRKEKLLTMLDLWKLKKYDTKIDYELLKIYILLGGLLKWTTSDGKQVRVMENLNWTQQLLLILLYCDEPISEKELFSTNPLAISLSKITVQPDDVEYHMLAQHSPWIVLSCSDKFRLNIQSWFLHETLVSYNVITQDWNTSLSDSIYLYMASQIQDLRWSIYFVVHVHNEYVRYRFVTDLLMKNASQLFDAEVELFILDNFHIDQKLIVEAKLLYSKLQDDPKSTAQLLLESGNFTQAHRLFVNECFHELVINDEPEELQNLIDLLIPYQQKLQNTWFTSGAGVFQTYLELCRFDKEVSDKSVYIKLLERFDSHQLKLSNKRHFLSQSLMSTVANLVRSSVQEGSSTTTHSKSEFFDSRMLSMIQSRLGEYRRQFPLNSRVRV